MGLGHLVLFYATLGCFCGSLVTASFGHYMIPLILGTRAVYVCTYSIVKIYCGRLV